MSVLSWFSGKVHTKNSVVALQITDDLLRFVEFKKKDEGYEVNHFGEKFLSRGIIVEGKVADPEHFIGVLKTLRKNHNLREVYVVLPEEQSLVFHTHVAKSPKGEMKQVIQDHIITYLKLHVPLAPRDLTCEYEIISETDHGYELQVSLIPDSVIASYQAVLVEAGLTPLSFEIGSKAVSRACIPDGQGGFIIVDFGDHRSHVAVAANGTIISSGTLDVGGAVLEKIIEEFLNITSHEARKIHQKYGLLKTHKEPELLSKLFEAVAPLRDFIDREYINWHKRPFENKGGEVMLDKIVLHGESAHMVGLLPHLASMLRIPVEHANVWKNVASFDEFIPGIPREDSLRYTTVLSTALKALEKEIQ